MDKQTLGQFDTAPTAVTVFHATDVPAAITEVTTKLLAVGPAELELQLHVRRATDATSYVSGYVVPEARPTFALREAIQRTALETAEAMINIARHTCDGLDQPTGDITPQMTMIQRALDNAVRALDVSHHHGVML